MGLTMEELDDLERNFVHLARVALSERSQDVQAFLYRIAKGKETSAELSSALVQAPSQEPYALNALAARQRSSRAS